MAESGPNGKIWGGTRWHLQTSWVRGLWGWGPLFPTTPLLGASSRLQSEVSTH